jgi:hypothetical protein
MLCLSVPSRSDALMCNTDKAGPPTLGAATAGASAKFLEAASEAFLLFKAAEQTSDASAAHADKVVQLLDQAIDGYKAALTRSDDLAQADKFLKERPFDKLRIIFGITPGTLEETRWTLLTKTAQSSATPTADFINVCVAGAGALKAATARVKAGLDRSQLRRVASNWYFVLMHGSMVSDAFDASVR